MCGDRAAIISQTLIALIQAVALFKQGRASSCPEVAASCATAVAALGALMHPRSLPVTAAAGHSGAGGCIVSWRVCLTVSHHLRHSCVRTSAQASYVVGRGPPAG